MLKSVRNAQKIATITGYSLILMSLSAGFSIGYAFPFFFDSSKIDFIKDIIRQNSTLYLFMLIGLLLVVFLDFLVSWTLYLYFKESNKNISLASFFLRSIYSFVFLSALYYLMLNVGENNNNIVLKNFNLFETIWNWGLIIFGLHLFLVGLLMKLHKAINHFLCYMTAFAGISYFIVHLLKVSISTESANFVTTLNNILALPMALGELGLAVWLIIKGGKFKEGSNN